jgi:hypothetical protein
VVPALELAICVAVRGRPPPGRPAEPGRAELTDPLSPDARHYVVGDVDEDARGIDEQRFEHHFGGLSSAR